MQPIVIIPAFQAEGRIGKVIEGLRQSPSRAGSPLSVLVVDDGSTDRTAAEARDAGARVESHGNNRGKGAALRTGLLWAARAGYARAVTADADGQHPGTEILRLASLEPEPGTIVLGVRSLARDGAPRKNQFSNKTSNYFVSRFTGLRLRDTQCGLRVYPVKETLSLGCSDDGFAFETEVLLRAARRGIPIAQVPIAVLYPKPAERLTHFDNVRDPFRIIMRVLRTLAEDR